MTDFPPPVVSIEDVLADPGLTDANPRRGEFEARFAFIGRSRHRGPRHQPHRGAATLQGFPAALPLREP